ncbi:hypothetical protein, partial [Neisseria meningitidis]|uniref:hypothetical protein n=1 Tax=Neisseria meningitidis TaxID=487 RepID=UPI00195B4D50
REAVDVFGNHGLGGLPEEGTHGKSPKCLGGNLGDFGEFCKGLRLKHCEISGGIGLLGGIFLKRLTRRKRCICRRGR